MVTMNVVLGDFVAFLDAVFKLFENKKLHQYLFEENPDVGEFVVIGLIILGIWLFKRDWSRYSK